MAGNCEICHQNFKVHHQTGTEKNTPASQAYNPPTGLCLWAAQDRWASDHKHEEGWEQKQPHLRQSRICHQLGALS
jgi:hypothetical protein